MIIKEQLSKLPDDLLKKEMLKLILKEVDVSDEIYQKSFKDTYKVNVDICGVKGYQIYEKDKYIPKFGESLQDPDVNIIFRNMDYVRQLLQGEKVGIEAGRDSNYVLHLNRKDTLFSTRMRTEERNAQVLLAKIPIFNQVVKNFGTSRQGRRLRDQPDIDPVKDGEIASLMKKMLSETVDDTDDLYRKNFHGHVWKVTWESAGNFAYQIFEEIRYSYEFGKHIEDADITLVSKNQEHAKRFLQNISTNYAPGLDDDDNLLIYVKNPVISIQFKDPDATRFSLVKLPFFRTMSQQQSNSETSEEEKDERENYGHYVPVNLPMGDFEDVIVPYNVLEYFINKSSNIILRTCPCRERWS